MSFKGWSCTADVCSSRVESLPSMCEILGSIASVEKDKGKKKRKQAGVSCDLARTASSSLKASFLEKGLLCHFSLKSGKTSFPCHWSGGLTCPLLKQPLAAER